MDMFEGCSVVIKWGEWNIEHRGGMMDIRNFMEWAKEEFPSALDNHFSYQLLENSINFAIRYSNATVEDMLDNLTSVVPEITRSEWEEHLFTTGEKEKNRDSIER